MDTTTTTTTTKIKNLVANHKKAVVAGLLIFFIGAVVSISLTASLPIAAASTVFMATVGGLIFTVLLLAVTAVLLGIFFYYAVEMQSQWKWPLLAFIALSGLFLFLFVVAAAIGAALGAPAAGGVLGLLAALPGAAIASLAVGAVSIVLVLVGVGLGLAIVLYGFDYLSQRHKPKLIEDDKALINNNNNETPADDDKALINNNNNNETPADDDKALINNNNNNETPADDDKALINNNNNNETPAEDDTPNKQITPPKQPFFSGMGSNADNKINNDEKLPVPALQVNIQKELQPSDKDISKLKLVYNSLLKGWEGVFDKGESLKKLLDELNSKKDNIMNAFESGNNSAEKTIASEAKKLKSSYNVAQENLQKAMEEAIVKRRDKMLRKKDSAKEKINLLKNDEKKTELLENLNNLYENLEGMFKESVKIKQWPMLKEVSVNLSYNVDTEKVTELLEEINSVWYERLKLLHQVDVPFLEEKKKACEQLLLRSKKASKKTKLLSQLKESLGMLEELLNKYALRREKDNKSLSVSVSQKIHLLLKRYNRDCTEVFMDRNNPKILRASELLEKDISSNKDEVTSLSNKIDKAFLEDRKKDYAQLLSDLESLKQKDDELKKSLTQSLKKVVKKHLDANNDSKLLLAFGEYKEINEKYTKDRDQLAKAEERSGAEEG